MYTIISWYLWTNWMVDMYLYGNFYYLNLHILVYFYANRCCIAGVASLNVRERVIPTLFMARNNRSKRQAVQLYGVQLAPLKVNNGG